MFAELVDMSIHDRHNVPMATLSTIKPANLPDELLAEGISSFDAAFAADRIGSTPGRVHGALKRLVDGGKIFSPARGFYVIIPPQYRKWGAVPASWFVDSMMNHLGRTYYVGLLSAAELSGAAHQRPQAFQVVVDKYLADRTFGRVRMEFLINRHVAELPTTTVNAPTGTVRLSTPAVTALDLADRPLDAGGLDNVATTLIELVDQHPITDKELINLAPWYPSASLRRLAHLYETFCGGSLDTLHANISPERREPALLDPAGARRGSVSRRWNLRLNTTVEPDL